ncbi:MAG: hypothetical protein ACJA0C_000191 [Candidatus Endobugula sp.]|jgi:hypothetical protein
MLEKHRLTYLDALGIENYMPRYQLVNALPSQLLSDDALREPTAFSTADMQSSIALTGDKSATESSLVRDDAVQDPHTLQKDSELSHVASTVATDVMSALGIVQQGNKGVGSTTLRAELEKQNVSDPEPSVDKTELVPALDKADIRFSLNIWRIKNELLVIDSRQPAAALPTEKLLQNILRSIGYPLAQLPPSDLVRWPLFSSKKFTNKKSTQLESNQSSEEDEARAMVQAYLSAQCSRAPIKTLLLLGKNAANFALTPAEGEDANMFYDQHKGTAVDTPLWESKVLVAPSLVDMLHDPMQKRMTWQALQTLFVE